MNYLFEEDQIFPTNQLQAIHNRNHKQIEFEAAIALTGALKTLSQTLSVKIALNIIVPLFQQRLSMSNEQGRGRCAYCTY